MAVQRDTSGQIERPVNRQFAQDLKEGFEQELKHIPSKYFYDDQGSKLFQAIMGMPEYYLTDAEFEILETQSMAIHKQLAWQEPFRIVELGAGDGKKTIQMLRAFEQAGLDFIFSPLDISEEAIRLLEASVREQLPSIKMESHVGDYFDYLGDSGTHKLPTLILFLGSNIGNYNESSATDLLKLIASNMNEKDALLVGFDLKKNPNTIKLAYDDPHGITRAFNLNLLERANRELGADFALDQFDFYCHYSPESGEVKSYLVSLKKQTVDFKHLNWQVDFEANELIWTEMSKKYSVEQIDKLGAGAGLQTESQFLDCKHFFSDCLFRKQPTH